MFRVNDRHNQTSFLDSRNFMSTRIRDKLEKSWAQSFYDHVFCKIDEKPFAALYGTTGNPNFPVNILLSLEYIKHMKDISDLELLDRYCFDYQVNYALGIRTLGELNLSERTLYYFRERIYQYSIEHPDKEDLLFAPFIQLTENFAREAKISFTEQRADSTMFMSNIKKSGRLALCFDVLVRAVKAIPEQLRPEQLQSVLDPSFKTDTLYRAKAQEGESKLSVLLQLCQQSLEVLQNLPDEVDELAWLRRYLDEQTDTDLATGRRTPKANKDIKSGSIQSAYDQDATYRRKGDTKQSGYVLQISETCADENPFQLLTDYAVAPNNVSDQELVVNRMPALHDTGCEDLYVDGGYHSETVNQTAEEQKIKLHLTNMSGTRPSKKMEATSFDIDEQTLEIVKCPAGQTPTRVSINNSQTVAHFEPGTCEQCPLRAICYSKSQKKDNVVRISLNSVKTAFERAQIREDIKENTSKRAAIEGSCSSLKRCGQDKLPVRGRIRTTFYSALKVTAQNIKRFVRFKQGGYASKDATALPQAANPQGMFMPICA